MVNEIEASRVELPDGRVVNVVPVETDDGFQKPDVISINRGPYQVYVIVSMTDDTFRVQRPLYVRKKRPALFGPETFINDDTFTEVNSLIGLRGAV